jgi:GNAT superfamily N-acetyltransferase
VRPDSPIIVETANPRDITVCLRLLRQAQGPDLSGDYEQILLQLIRDQRSNLYVGWLDTEAVGVAVVHRRISLEYRGVVWEVEGLVVDENFRQLGFGRAMIEQILADARRGVCRALLVPCDETNRLGRLFLNRLQFVNTGRAIYRTFADGD